MFHVQCRLIRLIVTYDGAYKSICIFSCSHSFSLPCNATTANSKQQWIIDDEIFNWLVILCDILNLLYSFGSVAGRWHYVHFNFRLVSSECPNFPFLLFYFSLRTFAIFITPASQVAWLETEWIPTVFHVYAASIFHPSLSARGSLLLLSLELS